MVIKNDAQISGRSEKNTVEFLQKIRGKIEEDPTKTIFITDQSGFKLEMLLFVSENTYLLQFYEINVCRIMSFGLITVYKKYDGDKN